MTDPKPPVGQQAELCPNCKWPKNYPAWTSWDGVQCTNDFHKTVASPVTLSGEKLKFCIPSDRQPQYLLMYDDPEVGFSLFDSKEDAMMAFAAANIGWDVWLFEPVAVTPSEGQDTQEKK